MCVCDVGICDSALAVGLCHGTQSHQRVHVYFQGYRRDDVLRRHGWGVGTICCGIGISRIGLALACAIVTGMAGALGTLAPMILFHADALRTRLAWRSWAACY